MALSLPLFLAVSGFCSGSETALFSLSQHERRQISLSSRLLDRKLAWLLGEVRGLLISLLLTNMIVNVLFFVVSTMLLLQLGRLYKLNAAYTTGGSVASLLLLIIFGEVLPKMLSARTPMSAARLVALPLWLLHRVLTPIRHVLSTLVITPLSRLIAPRQKPPELSTQELEMLLEQSQHHGVIDAGEEELLQQVLGLSQLKVRDIMQPRVDIQAYDIVDPPVLLIEQMRATRLDRLVVYEDDLDHVVGLAYARQVLLRRPANRKELEPLIRQVTYVPETQRVDKLLIHMRKKGVTLAVVVDEFGGTSGIVTLEDVVGQMIGHISAPYESQDEQMVVQLSEGRWRVSGDLPVHEWADAFGSVTQMSGVSTVGGLVMAKLRRLPQVGDSVMVGNLRFEVQAMQGRRIAHLYLELDHAPPAKSEPQVSLAADAEREVNP